jgi:hypothetical protein
MKKSVALLIVLVILLYSPSIFAASYFTNNKDLDATFTQLEKAFLKSEQVYFPLEGEFDVITGPIVNKALPKMTNEVLKAAVNKRLNDIRVAIEIREERLGGLSKEEYKMISEELLHESITIGGEFYWEAGNKTIWLTFGTADDEFEEFDGLVGNFKRMGKEKDEVSQADLQVEVKIKKYFNQSIQAGNKVSPEIMEKLPGKLESLFKELELSKIITAQIMSVIHEQIYKSNVERFDGSESIESIIESCQFIIEMLQEDRDSERQIEVYRFPNDLPSPEVKEDLIKKILNGELSDSFTSGFKNPMTLGDLAKLYFESAELDEKIQLEANSIYKNSPNYIKMAYIYGMINGKGDLEKPLTRLEASRRLVVGNIYEKSPINEALRINDSAKIPSEDIVTVANSGLRIRGLNFEPQSMYTKQEAILDRTVFEFRNVIRGYKIRIHLDELSKLIVGENTVHMLFENNEQLEEYLQSNFEDTAIGDIKRNGSYMRIDTGCALIELFTPEKGIKFTFKNGIKFADFAEEVYGPELSNKIESRVLKAGEKVSMDMQVDSIHKKLYQRLDSILTKIIKPGMTTEQKIKAIHDYVVTHIIYDLNYDSEDTPEAVLMTLDKGRGVCGGYAFLFEYLCDRASIPCVSEGGTSITSPVTPNHIWNAVFLNGEWKFVDTTWDDGNEKKISYKYFLNDKFTFMKDHSPKMGIPDIDSYPEFDGMNIKSQEELRVYVLRKFYWIDGFKVTFRMADKKLKPYVGYVWASPEVQAVLTYDAIKDLYTLTAKKK